MELECVEITCLIAHGRVGTGERTRGGLEALRHDLDLVTMAHPNVEFLRQACEEAVTRHGLDAGMAVLGGACRA